MDAPQPVALDIDGIEIPPYGQQEQSACSGHFKSTCYHLGRRRNRSRPAGGGILIPTMSQWVAWFLDIFRAARGLVAAQQVTSAAP
jgi:hypothetical protein